MVDEDIMLAIDSLKAGKVGVFPTDTAYGIGCRMDDVAAVKRVYALRNRPAEKALLVLVSSIAMAMEYVTIPQKVRDELIDRYWPGGLTIILRCKTDKVPAVVRANGMTLALRMPDHKALREIIDRVGVPIVAPSANFSGAPTPFDFSDIDTNLLSHVDFIVHGMCTIRGVSTIIDCAYNEWRIIRDGVIDLKIEN